MYIEIYKNIVEWESSFFTEPPPVIMPLVGSNYVEFLIEIELNKNMKEKYI